jgi:hypothetical protein
MIAIVLYTIFWPVIVVCKVSEVFTWELFSNKNWKVRSQPNLTKYWQNQALAAQYQLRDAEIKSGLQQDELEKKFQLAQKQRGQR